MLRKIIKINEEKCNGCGNCVPECHEGALQIIDGKARLISDLFCDGLGACVGFCPEGAMTIEEREAEPYDERKVMETIIKGGPNVIKAHLEHLRDHEEYEYLQTAVAVLKEKGIGVNLAGTEKKTHHQGCPGSREQQITPEEEIENTVRQGSKLRQWPIQLHLVSPNAAYYRGADLLLAADCAGFASANFHSDFIDGKSIAIACPKLDGNQEVYLDKLVTMIKDSGLRSITVVIMQVPCCSGLFQTAKKAVELAGVDIPFKVAVMGINGEILKEVEV